MCMWEGVDYEWRSLGETQPVARKEHRCSDCGRTIQVGERYKRHVFISDEGLENCVQCDRCKAATNWLDLVCGGWLYNAVNEDIAEHWGEHPEFRSLALGHLVVAARRGWSRKDGTLYTPEAIRRWAIEGGALAMAAANRAEASVH
jgi:hypothetical protein